MNSSSKGVSADTEKREKRILIIEKNIAELQEKINRLASVLFEYLTYLDNQT